MRVIYSFILEITQFLLPVLGLLGSKMKHFSSGRTTVYEDLQSSFALGEKVIWFHAASLGEFEQGVPIIKDVKKIYPDTKILVTFFSPSGYMYKKNTSLADCVTYLPLDTTSNAKRFLNSVHIELAFFIKYEFWPNFLNELQKRNIRTFLVSGVFRESQPFFKIYGKWMTRYLQAFEYFFLQDSASYENLKKLGFTNGVISGDTRFDRVSNQLEMDNTVEFLDVFVKNNLCLVCGSTWPEDDEYVLEFINSYALENKIKVIVAPHEIKEEKINTLQAKLKGTSILYSQLNKGDLYSKQVLILDTIGFLGRAYSYAHVAYVGGAVGGTGLHNILEPATFGIPILCGNAVDKFPEAQRLRQLAGLYTVNSVEETTHVLKEFFDNHSFREKAGMISGHFIQSNTGATHKVLDYLKQDS